MYSGLTQIIIRLAGLVLLSLAGCSATCTDACEAQAVCWGQELHGNPEVCAATCERDTLVSKQAVIDCYVGANCTDMKAGACDLDCKAICAANTCYPEDTCLQRCGPWESPLLDCAARNACETWASTCPAAAEAFAEPETTAAADSAP